MNNAYFSWMAVPPERDEPSARDGMRSEIVLDPGADRATLVATVATMSTEQIAIAWRATGLLLETTTPHGATQLAGLRQLLLDELERSHPRAFRRWLRNGGPRPGPDLR